MGNLLCCRKGKSKQPKNHASISYVVENGDRKHVPVPSCNRTIQQHAAIRHVPKRQTKKCAACGELGHPTESCRYFTRLCFYCRQEGHIIRICPTRKRVNQRRAIRANPNGSVYRPVSIQEPRIIYRKPKQQRHIAPGGMRRKSRTPVGTVIALGTIEDFADDDTLKRSNSSGCNDIFYHIICCCL